jgi:molybdopterin-containing oxidoreductase family membrane subunit
VYFPTWVDAGVYIGTLGTFFMLYLLFVRFLPMIPVSEVKGVTAEADPHRAVAVKGGKP